MSIQDIDTYFATRRTIRAYDPEREIPILVEAGNYIRFVPIDEEQYKRIQAQVAEGSYQCVIHEEV